MTDMLDEKGIIERVTLTLGGRSENVLEVVFVIKTLTGQWEGFTATTGVNLLDRQQAELLRDLMLACHVKDLEGLRYKVVTTHITGNGTLRGISPVKGIYRDD